MGRPFVSARRALVPQCGCAHWVTRRTPLTPPAGERDPHEQRYIDLIDQNPVADRRGNLPVEDPRRRRTGRRQYSRVSGSLPPYLADLRLHDHRRAAGSPCDSRYAEPRFTAGRLAHGPSSFGLRGSTGGGNALPSRHHAPAAIPSRVHESSVRVHPVRCQCCAIACSTRSSRSISASIRR